MPLPRVRQLTIKNGKIGLIYDDRMAPFLSLGVSTVRRASHVEPTTIDGKIKWTADMSPSDGPSLGPFDTRADALIAEIAWLNENHPMLK